VLSVDTACRLGSSSQTWTFPTTWTGTSSIKNDDHRGDIVGRWMSCGGPQLPLGPYPAIEFAGNGRWRMLGNDASGAYVGEATGGDYYVLGNGQVDLSDGTPENLGGWGGFLAFANGNRDVLRFGNSLNSPVYARLPPSATNGDDNRPSASDGHCSMVGTWDVPADTGPPGAPASVWSFDETGRFVVGAPNDLLCGAHTMWGTYDLPADGYFHITTNWNLGACDWWFAAAYPYTFSADCSALTLTQKYDNCTGGRGYLNGMTTLRRRR
jgi:hypothetical protein